MHNYKLLTPGPLTTASTVKEDMLFDRCMRDEEYKEITRKIRTQLLEYANAGKEDYTAVFKQGSGSFVVESVLTAAIAFVITKLDKLLACKWNARSFSLDLFEQWMKWTRVENSASSLMLPSLPHFQKLSMNWLKNIWGWQQNE